MESTNLSYPTTGTAGTTEWYFDPSRRSHGGLLRLMTSLGGWVLHQVDIRECKLWLMIGSTERSPLIGPAFFELAPILILRMSRWNNWKPDNDTITVLGQYLKPTMT